ncbi:MAG: hypothetical protein LBC38_03800 [Oscillospiraceae bacterium]|jgi:hypothetical protein|nr:hypothetical protein [Oscillospiraceae bacterium]
MQKFDTSNKAGLETAMLRWLKDFAGDQLCPVQVWYECLGGYGTPSADDEAAIAEVLNAQPVWKSVGNVRYEKYGSQPTWNKLTGQSQPPAADSQHFAVHHLFKVNGVYAAPNGKKYKVVLSEVYNLRCFEVDDNGNMSGPMVKIHPTGEFAKTLKAV